MIKLGVIFGGESVEHEISIISAVQAMNKIDSEKYDIIPIYITKEGEWYTSKALMDIEIFQDFDLLKRYSKNVVLYKKDGRFLLQSKGLFKRIVTELDMMFPVVHGTNVEDGVLQGYLRTVGIPFVGSDVLSSSIAQDKVVQKQVFQATDLPITKYIWFYDSEYLDDKDEVLKKIKKLKFPVIIKPASLGSSVGISSCSKIEDIDEKIMDAINYDNKIVIEEMVSNLTEVNISVLGNYQNQSLSEIEEVMSDNDLLTYEDKYVGGGKKGSASKGMASACRKIPATINNKLKDEVRDIAIKAFKALNSSGNVRIDFLIDKKANKVYINEINSCPGSLAFYLWEPIGKDYTELLDDMINIGVKDYKSRIKKVHSFDTNILKGFAGTKGLKGIKGSKLKR